MVLNEDYNYSFGVTSKLQHESMNIDELLIKFPFQFGIEETQWLRKTLLLQLHHYLNCLLKVNIHWKLGHGLIILKNCVSVS